MLGNVLPGLRELRAPLAAGYLWLVLSWVIWAEALPSNDEVAGPLERLYQLEPVISDVGRAVVASVAAYIVGSIVIDLQGPVGRMSIVIEDRAGWSISQRLPLTDAGSRIRDGLLEERGLPGITAPRDDEPEDEFEKRWAVRESVLQSVSNWIDENREVVKTRMLDLSPSLHTQVDRPDAEATFRMALWPPLAAVAMYLAISVNAVWLTALLIPALLAWQWIRLRRQANDALFTAIAARSELRDMFLEGVERGVAERASRNQHAPSKRRSTEYTAADVPPE